MTVRPETIVTEVRIQVHQNGKVSVLHPKDLTQVVQIIACALKQISDRQCREAAQVKKPMIVVPEMQVRFGGNGG